MTLGASPSRKGKKKQKRPTTFCWVCLQNPKYGRCLVCGYSAGRKGIDPKFVSRLDWLKQTKAQLKHYNQRSTGDPDLDLEIFRRLSGWGGGMIPFRDPVTFKIEFLYHCETPWELNPEEGGVDWKNLTEEDQKEIKEDYTLPSDCPHDLQTWKRKYKRPVSITKETDD